MTLMFLVNFYNDLLDFVLKIVGSLRIFDPNYPLFKKKSQNNQFFRLFPKLPRFEEVAPNELAPTL